MKRRLKRRFIIIAAFALIGFQIFLFQWCYNGLLKNKEHVNRKDHTYKVLRPGDELLATLLADAKTNHQGYIIPGNEKKLIQIFFVALINN